MSALERLESILNASTFTEEERSTICFALGVLCTIEDPIISMAEKKGGVPYKKIAQDMIGTDTWGALVPNPNN